MAGGRPRGRVVRRLSAAAHGTRESPVLRAAYEGLIAAELWAARMVASGRVASRRPDRQASGSLTLVVKTFERPAVLRRMLAGARRVFDGPIVVADDSHEPFVTDDPLVTVLRLPFDTGVGAGRNALIDAVTTEYLWMADDDMVVLPDLDVGRALAHLRRHPEVDLVGGRVVNLPTFRSADYASAALFARVGAPRLAEGTIVDGRPVYYKVPNFYLARTASVRAVRYDDRLKRVDHNDFFTSAYGRLLCTYDRDFVCLHAHGAFDAHYQRFRMDTAADFAVLAEKWGGQERLAGGDGFGRVNDGSNARGGSTLLALGGAGAADLLSEPARRAFHVAALRLVADDLGVRASPSAADSLVTVTVPHADRERYLATLRQLGWSGRGGRVAHVLWGDAVVQSLTHLPAAATATEEFQRPKPEELGAHLSRAAAVPGDHRVTEGEHARRPGTVTWSERAARFDEEDGSLVASLPLGPVVALLPPADEIWDAVGPEGCTLAAVVAAVLHQHPEAPPEAEEQIRACLNDLLARGLLRQG